MRCHREQMLTKHRRLAEAEIATFEPRSIADHQYISESTVTQLPHECTAKSRYKRSLAEAHSAQKLRRSYAEKVNTLVQYQRQAQL